jgi:uncharacterized membrane protein
VPDIVLDVVADIARIGEIIGAGTLILGFLITTVRFLIQLRTADVASAYELYRQSLGRTVVIGLEIIVAVTIITTITVEPTAESLGLLALMILIRTVLAWTTVLEMSGRWPWQKAPARNP